jgi:hypothetical protein
VSSERRRRAARTLQVDWFDATAQPAWTADVQRWLIDKGTASGAAP